MIFLTTGTQLPFDRLVQAVDEWAEATKPDCDIFGQVLSPTHNPYRPRNFKTKARLSPAEYAEVFAKAQRALGPTAGIDGGKEGGGNEAEEEEGPEAKSCAPVGVTMGPLP